MPGQVKLQKISTANGSDQRQLEIQHNNALTDAQQLAYALTSSLVQGWHTAAANSGQGLGRGSTDTAVASGALSFTIFGVPAAKAAVTTGTAPTAQTVPASLWASYALDIVAAGTITVSPAALNTTGYATEALAIAAVPARLTAQARMGYYTVLASASTWIGATDALAGGSTGNPATTTNYYPADGIFAATGLAYGPDGVTVTSGGQGVQGGVAAVGNGTMWTGGRNGVLIPSTLARGSTDTQIATIAFTYNARGISDIAKAAVAAGTALGALGTIPADKWGIYVVLINSTGTITLMSGPSNYTTGYDSDPQAQRDLYRIFPAANLCQIGYFTVKTASGLPWVTGTDALAGGTTGNEASFTNYYPTQGITVGTGQTASAIANRAGVVLTSAQF